MFPAESGVVSFARDKPGDADVFVNVRPVYPDAVADKLEVRALHGACVPEPRVETKGHSESAPFRETHPQVFVVAPDSRDERFSY